MFEGIGDRARSNAFVLTKIAQVIEMAGLQVGSRRADIRHRSLDHDVGGDIFDRRIRDIMDEADVLVFYCLYVES